MASLNSNSKQIKVLIGTPAYGGMCCTAYTEALLYTTMFLSQKNIVSYEMINLLCNIFFLFHEKKCEKKIVNDYSGM